MTVFESEYLPFILIGCQSNNLPSNEEHTLRDFYNFWQVFLLFMNTIDSTKYHQFLYKSCKVISCIKYKLVHLLDILLTLQILYLPYLLYFPYGYFILSFHLCCLCALSVVVELQSLSCKKSLLFWEHFLYTYVANIRYFFIINIVIFNKNFQQVFILWHCRKLNDLFLLLLLWLHPFLPFLLVIFLS